MTNTCVFCGQPYDAHLDFRPMGDPAPRMPCLGLKSGFRPLGASAKPNDTTVTARFSAPSFRLYFNRAADAPKVWSIDFGPGTAELSCVSVEILRRGVTVFQLDAGDGKGERGVDIKSPRCWISFEGGTVELREDGSAVIR